MMTGSALADAYVMAMAALAFMASMASSSSAMMCGARCAAVRGSRQEEGGMHKHQDCKRAGRTSE